MYVLMMGPLAALALTSERIIRSQVIVINESTHSAKEHRPPKVCFQSCRHQRTLPVLILTKDDHGSESKQDTIDDQADSFPTKSKDEQTGSVCIVCESCKHGNTSCTRFCVGLVYECVAQKTPHIGGSWRRQVAPIFSILPNIKVCFLSPHG